MGLAVIIILLMDSDLKRPDERYGENTALTVNEKFEERRNLLRILLILYGF